MKGNRASFCSTVFIVHQSNGRDLVNRKTAFADVVKSRRGAVSKGRCSGNARVGVITLLAGCAFSSENPLRLCLSKRRIRTRYVMEMKKKNYRPVKCLKTVISFRCEAHQSVPCQEIRVAPGVGCGACRCHGRTWKWEQDCILRASFGYGRAEYRQPQSGG